MFDQAAIIATLLHGPGHLPHGLFAGSEAAVLRGLRVHANTISHARLVALEDSFPRTRAFLGEDEFNRLSRDFIEAGGAQRRSLSDIGADFSAWLADPLAADLARAERAWFESYNAAEKLALTLADLAGLCEAGLLGLAVRCHPAARIVTLSSDAAPLVDPAFAPDVTGLLITRPRAEVRLFAVENADAAAIAIAQEICPIGNLIAHLAEHHDDGGAAIAALIDAGAFEKV
ncbi:HvfC/BufC N-terminal domain-containing protein [Sphingopyxis fribergensis]|uniref:HvfC/BufC N-terminal domain-containing protein n=1 Tax=Sphingopyxis fribergensis TaxID=1515612 RepID=UPI000AF03546|nr:DNA-binding domain-containing protein [Sphingopyxis fribergensis]